MKRYLLHFIAFTAIVALCASCSKITDPVVVPELKTISLGRDTLTLTVGQTFQLDVKLTPSDYDKSLIKMAASDSTVIAVTNSGKITAKKAGISVIIATNDKQTISVTCLVSVVSKPVIDSLKMGLLLYLPFNNSGADSSGKGNHSIIHEITSVPNRFGTANTAYYFNGTSSYILVKDRPELRLSNTDFTLNMWINLDEYNISSGSALLAKNSGPYQNGWNCSITGLGTTNTNIGNAFYNVSGGDDPHAVGNTVVSLHQWRMVTITYSLSLQRISFYINGKFDHATDGIPTPNPTTAVDLFIGKNSYIDPSGLTPPYYIKGKLDDIRIYNRIISPAQITKLYTLPY